MELRVLRSCLVALLVIVHCVSTLALETRERRTKSPRSIDVVGQQSSSHQQSQAAQRIRLPRRLFGRHDEFDTSTESAAKKHMLIGGHLRTQTETESTASDSSFDDGLLLSSAGNGNERKSSTKSTASSSSDDDEKKTLSQQVKEGKYGLIQNEIYPEKPKRPGIISYSANPEVPRDTASNLGGLDEEEIWLAENHVLVIKGGNFPDSDSSITEQQQLADNSWPPIDDYKAPRRQVKIPPRPKVPPPFPVQLIEGGPIQLIGTNSTSLAENGTIDFEAIPGGFKGFLPGEGPYFPLPGAPSTINASSGAGPPEKKHKAEPGPPGPFYPALPPGAVIVPPPSNQTDYDDEDQSIYYPPPYSFVYPQDNSTAIPPGPLVPGIILPPPPDFFSSLDDKKSATKDKFLYPKRPSTTPIPARPSYLPPPRKSSTKHYKTPSVTSTPLGSKTVSYNPKPFNRSKLKNLTSYRTLPEKTTPRAYQTFVEVTSSPAAPIESTTLESPPQEKYRHFKPILANQVQIETSTEKPWRQVVSSRPVPLLTFYASTTPSSVDEPVETTPASIQNVLTTENPAARYPSQASYYFYEEANSASSNKNNNDEDTPSSTVDPVIFFSTTAETPPYYKLEQQAQPEDEKKDYYDVEMIPSQQTSKDYNVKLIDSIVKDPQIYRYLDSGATSSHEKYETQPVRSQNPRMLHSEPLYYQPAPSRSPPKLSYFRPSTTARPKSYYRQPEQPEYSSKPTSKPIYQYSFEATNYSKRGSHALSPKPEIVEEPQPLPQQQQQQQSRRQKELPLYQEYQDIQTVSDQYDYEGSEAVADQKLQTEKVPYLSSKHKERSYYHQHQSTTVSPIRDTTLAAHQQYFTKQDEQLLDDVTKEYFTMFGKKLSAGKLPSTTPIYGKSSVTERPQYTSVNSFNNAQPDYGSARQFRPPNIKVHYGDQTPGPYSLQNDERVNYKRPLPPINPDSEFIPVVNPSPRPPALNYRPRPVLQVSSQLRDYSLQPLVGNTRQRFDQLRGYNTQRTDQQQQQQQQQLPQRGNTFVPINDPREAIRGYQPQRPISLEGDVAVNYKNPRPPINPDAEFIPSRVDGNADKANSYFAYRLPGDGGHFYFLTPQAINREDSNGGGYLYSRPRDSRLLRRRRGRDGD